jgi:hypothetical protein
MAGKLGQHAVVVGASVAGLIAARVLAEHFDEVTAIEQDELSSLPVIHKSVPQGHHLHAMLAGGIKVMSSLYPDFTEELVRRGTTKVTMVPAGRQGLQPDRLNSRPLRFRHCRLLRQPWAHRVRHPQPDGRDRQHPPHERNGGARTDLRAGPGARHSHRRGANA